MTHYPVRRGIALLAVSAVACLPPSPAHSAQATPRPTSYVVTDVEGTNPEGIEVTRDGEMFVTSVMTGAVFRGTTDDATMQEWLPAGADGRTSATGIHQDRWGRLVVAGGSSGHLFLYDTDGTLLDRVSAPGEAFLNDFDFTADALYLTDSASGTLYRASLDEGGLGELEPFWTTQGLGVDFLNGIQVTPGERYALVGDWGVATWRVDLATGAAQRVQVAGGEALGADGMLLRGHTAANVMIDFDTAEGWLRTVRYNADFTRARVVADSPRVGAQQSPTTVARDRGRLLWVNSQLNATTQQEPYVVSVVPR